MMQCNFNGQMLFEGTIESNQSAANNQTAALTPRPYIPDISPIIKVQETLFEPEFVMPPTFVNYV